MSPEGDASQRTERLTETETQHRGTQRHVEGTDTCAPQRHRGTYRHTETYAHTLGGCQKDDPLLGCPIYEVSYSNRDPERDHDFDNHPHAHLVPAK